jgi:hypothetical protein
VLDGGASSECCGSELSREEATIEKERGEGRRRQERIGRES